MDPNIGWLHLKKTWKQGTMSFGVILVKAPIELTCLLLDRFGFFFGVPFR